jgi:DNA end-binding protein Ku
MARPIWRGTITFGLVAVPVGLFPATRHREVGFHLLHDRDGARIREKRICSADGDEVPYEHVVKGYEVARGRYVMVTPEELAALDPRATRTIEIEEFVGLDEIDPIYFERTYYLAPERGGARPYALLLDAMRAKNRVAIGRFVLRARQSLCVLRPMGGALALSTMSWPDEVLPVSDVEGLPVSAARPKARELEMAEQLVGALSGKFEPEKFHDEHRARVLELLERKQAGEEIVTPEETAPRAAVINLIDALKASLRKKPKATPVTRARRKTAKRKSAKSGRG